jgi:hypothetical protein
MSLSMHLLASGPGWRVEDVVCSAGPHDRPFEEQHDLVRVAAVTRGTFEYRTPDGRATLVPGALMLGNPGACFECGHEHGSGIVAYRFISARNISRRSSPRFRGLGASPSPYRASHLRRGCSLSSRPPRRPTTILHLRRLRYELPPPPSRWGAVQARQSAIYGMNVG